MFEKITSKLAEYLNIDKSEITKDTDIKKDLNADSLTVVELLFALEEEYGIVIDDEEIESLSTVGSLVEYIERVTA